MRSFRVASLLWLVSACAAGQSPPPAKEFDGQQALAYVATQLQFGPRIPGQPGHAAMAAWLDSMARARADTVVVQRWWHHPKTGDSVPMVNVIARFNVQATDRVLYLAHWDTRPRTDGPNAKIKDGLVPGANDGASGVAVLLGVMDALKKQPPAMGVDLVFVDGEDFGYFGPEPPKADVLIGSTYYAGHQVTAQPPLFAVLFDMVGDKDLRLPIEQNSQIAAPDVVDKVWGVAEQMGFGHIFIRGSGGVIEDDHMPLINAGVHAIDIIDLDYPSWHTVDDTLDKVSAESLGAVGNVAVGVLRRAVK